MKAIRQLRRTIALLTAAALLAVSAAGCSGKKEEENKDLLRSVKEKGVLTVAMEGTWSPWTYHNEKDELVGFDVEVARYIADSLGVKVKFVEGEWDGLFAGLDAGMYDIIVNGVDETPERAEKYDFSDPYAYIHTVLVVRSDNKKIKSFKDLKGKTTANSIGSTYMELAEKYGATVKGVDSLGETMTMVISKRADATLNAEPSVLDYMKEQPDAPIKIAASTKDANHVCIPMRKGRNTASFRAEVNRALAEMREDGTLTKLSEKYFGSDITNE